MDIKRARNNHRQEQAKQLAARIYSYRLKCGLTQKALAAKVGLSHATVWRAETGCPITAPHFAQLQNFLTKNAPAKELKAFA